MKSFSISIEDAYRLLFCRSLPPLSFAFSIPLSQSVGRGHLAHVSCLSQLVRPSFIEKPSVSFPFAVFQFSSFTQPPTIIRPVYLPLLRRTLSCTYYHPTIVTLLSSTFIERRPATVYNYSIITTTTDNGSVSKANETKQLFGV